MIMLFSVIPFLFVFIFLPQIVNASCHDANVIMGGGIEPSGENYDFVVVGSSKEQQITGRDFTSTSQEAGSKAKDIGTDLYGAPPTSIVSTWNGEYYEVWLDYGIGAGGGGGSVSDPCAGVVCGSNAYCSGGSCGCNSPCQNCDGSWSTGCEININMDTNNCGSCGNPCMSGYGCFIGICKEFVSVEPSFVFSSPGKIEEFTVTVINQYRKNIGSMHGKIA